MKNGSKPYLSLQDWMERTGTNQTRLLAKLHKSGVDISRQHLGNILTGRYNCSLQMGLQLSEVTGIPVQNLIKWKRPKRRKQIERPFETGVQNA